MFMEFILAHLYEDILMATNHIENIQKELSKIKGNVITCGSGGSRVVAEFLNLVLSKKNHAIVQTVEPRDLNYLNLGLFQNLIVVSHSGSNYGVRSSLNKNINRYLLSTRKTKVYREILLHYDMENRHSFISLNATLVPMAILLKYYVGDSFLGLIEEMFLHIEKNMWLETDHIVNIFSGIDTHTVETFLESTFVEAGMGIPLIHHKYDYCHGRSTCNKKHEHAAIYLENKERDLDKTIKQVLENSMKDYIVIKGFSEDEVVNQFYMTLQAMYLCVNIAKGKKIDLANVSYDKEVVKTLYYFKGSM